MDIISSYSGFWRRTFLFLALIAPLPSNGQSSEGLTPVSGTYAITNVTITQSPGREIDKGTIVIKDGLIDQVGENVATPSDAIIIKADSMFAYAGFIDGFSHVGVRLPKSEKQEKVKYPGNPPPERAGITPYYDVRDFINPGDKSIAAFRNQGFTVSQVVPQGNLLPGQSAIILLAGNNTDDMVLADHSALYSELSGANNIYPRTIMGVMAKWRELYKQASLLKSYEVTYASNPVGLERPESDRILRAFYPVIDRSLPVLFKSEKVIETQRVLSLKRDLGFQLMIGDLKEGWPIVNKIKSSGATIFLSLELPEALKKDTTSNLSDEKKALEKRKEESINNYVSQASNFSRNGIRYGFSNNSVKPKDIHANLRRMISAGLSEENALAALTTIPAQSLGLSNRMGTIEKGKMANIVLIDKPLFSEKAKVKYVFVDGKLYKSEAKKSSGKKAKVDGAWSYTADTPQGKGSGKLVIKNNGGDYSGTITNNFSGQETSINEFLLEGNTMSFSYSIDIGGNQLQIAVSVLVDGDSFDGNMTAGQFGSFPMKGMKEPKSTN